MASNAHVPVRVIDTHTEGEPTRVVIEGGPDLGVGPLADRVEQFATEHDAFRRRVILEPRGSAAMVGALLCPPVDESCATGVVFFNNTGYLGMCGHGAIGVAAALAYQQRIALGNIKLETPVGVVGIELTTANTATVENVASYCYKSDVEIDVDGLGMIRGDIAWGGNWFFLVDGAPCPLNLANEAQLTRAAIDVKKSLQKYGVTGANGAEIDHIEFFAPPESDSANSRNFVLCPGDAYDRSPCGTGTSAKLACLAQRGMLGPGELWIQESVIGSRFTASYQRNDAGEIIPSITGRAFVCGETSLIFQSDDPFAAGIV